MPRIVTFSDLKQLIVEILRDTQKSARSAALDAGLPVRAIQAVLEDHMPSIERTAAICAALDLDLIIQPRDTTTDPSLGPPERSNDTVPADLTAALDLPAEATFPDVLAAIRALKDTPPWLEALRAELRNAVADALPGAPLEANQPPITPPAARAKARK